MEEFIGTFDFFGFEKSRNLLVTHPSQGIRPGDSGSPLFVVDRAKKPVCLLGVASMTIHTFPTSSTGPRENGSIFERVSFYKTWIKSTRRESARFWASVEQPRATAFEQYDDGYQNNQSSPVLCCTVL